MKKTTLVHSFRSTKFLILITIFMMSSLLFAWKWEQVPDPNGDDIDFVFPYELADDWICTSTGPIKTICFAYSWQHGFVGNISQIWVRIYSDVPDPDGQGPAYSMPGYIMWDQIFNAMGPDVQFLSGGSGLQGFYDPYQIIYFPQDHVQYYRCRIIIPDPLIFIQTANTVYWLSISVFIEGTERCGWKTSADAWNDEAVFFNGVWRLFPTIPPVDRNLAFRLSSVDEECPVELSSFNGTYSSGLCQINWVTESETNVQGYNIYRNTDNMLSTATKLNYQMINATNTSSTTNYQYQDTNITANQTYYYWLESNDYDGSTFMFGPINISTQDNTTPPPSIVTNMSLIYPNPARTINPEVDVAIKDSETGDLTIFNVRGQVVKSYALSAGNHHIEWNKTDSNGHRCAEGVYFYRLITPNLTVIRKVLIFD